MMFSTFLFLLFSQVNCHIDVINCILDYGGNVNGLNEEGLSALAACHILLYTNQDFVDNIAENMPKENSFNSIEWDKQKGCFMHRNDRKAVLSMYGTLRNTSGRSNRRKVSQGSSPGSLLNEKIMIKGEENNHGSSEEEESEEQIIIENWKLTYYQRTLNRSDELEEINRSFRNLKCAPFDEDLLENSRLPPLTFLKAEEIAKEVENSNKGNQSNEEENTEEQCEEIESKLSEASIYCGSSFGEAPRISMSRADTKQKLLNAER